MKKTYHHGDLRAALMDAALHVLSESGVDGFSLRETARRAGVSPGAPKHHFPDVRALLTAIAARAFEQLAEHLEKSAAAPRGDRMARIRRMGTAYVEFGLADPVRFDLMWRVALLDTADSAYRQAGDRAFTALDRLARGPEAPARERTHPDMAPTIACWSIVHGVTRLALEGGLGISELKPVIPRKFLDAILACLQLQIDE